MKTVPLRQMLVVTCLSLFSSTVQSQQAHVGLNSYPTIQQAINAATPGAVITLDAGTFTGNIVINKPLTLQGAGQGSTFIVTSASNPNCGGGGGGSLCAGGSNVILVQANNVTITDLTVDGNNPVLTSGITRSGSDIDARNGIITNHSAGVFNNLLVSNVTVRNIYLRGIYASSGGTFKFMNNTVQNVNGEGASVAIMNFNGRGLFIGNTVMDANDAIASNWSTGSRYSGNMVSNCGSGIHSDNNQVRRDTIENNTVSNGKTYGYGIWVFSPYVPVWVNGNTITNVYVGLANAGQATATTPVFSNNAVDGAGATDAIGVYQTTDRWGFGTTNVSGVYYNNDIRNTDYAFYNEYHAARTNSIIASNNSITANDYNVINGVSSGTLINDFKCNWWGTNDMPVIASKLDAGINHSPWLTSGNDASAATGFQPGGSCNGTAADNDGDGVLNASDCDPFDPAIGAANHTYYADADGDGYGNASSPVTVCSTLPPAGYVSNSSDCNDTQWTYADNDADGFGSGPNTPCGVANNFDSNDGDGKPLIFVCHKGNAIIINSNALSAHLGHGDSGGKCNNSNRAPQPAIYSQHISLTITPNPFTGRMNIRYVLPEDAKVSISLYDLLGREVATIHGGLRTAGTHVMQYNNQSLPAGSYYCRIVATGEQKYIQTIKIIKSTGL